MDEKPIVARYFETVRALLARFERDQAEALACAADVVAEALARGGILHLFGTGHSHMLAEEIFYRAGGLVAVDAMLDASVVLSGGALRSTDTERRSGSAAEVAARYDLKAGDAGVVISNSGRNPAPVEMAQLMKDRGMKVIAVTSLAHSRAMPPRAPMAVRLFEVADVVLDTGVPHGDAALEMNGVENPVGAVSTVVGAAVMQSLVLAAMERLVAAGQDVINLPSGNVEGRDPGRVLAEIAKYKARIRHL